MVNYVVANWEGHGSGNGGKGIQLLEYDPSGPWYGNGSRIPSGLAAPALSSLTGSTPQALRRRQRCACPGHAVVGTDAERGHHTESYPDELAAARSTARAGMSRELLARVAGAELLVRQCLPRTVSRWVEVHDRQPRAWGRVGFQPSSPLQLRPPHAAHCLDERPHVLEAGRQAETASETCNKIVPATW